MGFKLRIEWIGSGITLKRNDSGRNPHSMALNFIGEAMVLIRYCRDLHQRHINKVLCEELLVMYESARQEIRGPQAEMDEEVQHATVLS